MPRIKKQKKIDSTANSASPQIVKIGFWVVFAIIVIGFMWAFYNTFNKPSPTPESENDDLLDMVQNHIILPGGEPYISTVEEVDPAMRTQPFFAEAEDSDKIIIYPDKAFIYSPEKDKLINVGPVYAENPEVETNSQ